MPYSISFEVIMLKHSRWCSVLSMSCRINSLQSQCIPEVYFTQTYPDDNCKKYTISILLLEHIPQGLHAALLCKPTERSVKKHYIKQFHSLKWDTTYMVRKGSRVQLPSAAPLNYAMRDIATISKCNCASSILFLVWKLKSNWYKYHP